MTSGKTVERQKWTELNKKSPAESWDKVHRSRVKDQSRPKKPRSHSSVPLFIVKGVSERRVERVGVNLDTLGPARRSRTPPSKRSERFTIIGTEEGSQSDV